MLGVVLEEVDDGGEGGRFDLGLIEECEFFQCFGVLSACVVFGLCPADERAVECADGPFFSFPQRLLIDGIRLL